MNKREEEQWREEIRGNGDVERGGRGGGEVTGRRERLCNERNGKRQSGPGEEEREHIDTPLSPISL